MAFDATYPSELTTDRPNGSGANSDPKDGDNYIKELRTVLNTTFGTMSGALTATHTELNYLDLTTLGTAAASQAIVPDGSGNVNASSITWTNLGTVTTVDINGGTIDGATINGSTITASGNTLTIASTDLTDTADLTYNADTDVSGNGWVLDQDNLGDDSNTKVPTQQSVKAYVDSEVTTLNASISAVDSKYTMTHEIADVSTAETVYVPVPSTGTVVRMDTCLQGAITVADSTVTLVQSNDSAMASVTIAQSGSAAGDVDTDSSITNASVTAGDYLKLATDGGSSTAAKLLVTITVQTDTV